jgi:cysteine desulfurase
MNNGDRFLGRIVVDTRGTFCPTPIIKVSEAARNVDAGTVIEVLSDDPAIESDLPAWCKSTGYSIVSSSREGKEFRYCVRKKPDG